MFPRLQVNIPTFLWGTYTYLPFRAGYVYSIFSLISRESNHMYTTKNDKYGYDHSILQTLLIIVKLGSEITDQEQLK